MNPALRAIPFLVASIHQCAFSQAGTEGYPFDTPADPRSVALGESFVAIPSNPAALLYNPAGLAGLAGIHVSYSQRSLDRENDWTLRSFSASFGTPFGVFAAQYNRDSYGLLPLIIIEGEQPVMNTYDYDIAIGYAIRLGRGVSIGAAAKYYDYAGYTPDPSIESGSTFSTNPASLFDIGLTYTLPRLHSQAVVEDSVTIGMSYQNIGSNWRKSYFGTHELDRLPTGLPEYFRVGVSYALRARPGEDGNLSPFEAVLSGDFRSLQTIPYQASGSSEWRLGLECTIEEFLSLRGGASAIDDAPDRPLFRWGGAVRLPLHNLGFDVLLQYALIPEYSLSAFSIDVKYTGSRF